MGILTYLGLGSNVGDRATHLSTAVTRLGQTAGFAQVRTSSVWESEPWGGADQPPFLNAVVELRSQLVPPPLLEATQRIEWELGRRREEETRWGPRTIDIDLLFYGAMVLREPQLEIPHPRLHERRFVLEPLYELNPDLRHPRLQRTVAELLGSCTDASVVRRIAP